MAEKKLHSPDAAKAAPNILVNLFDTFSDFAFEDRDINGGDLVNAFGEWLRRNVPAIKAMPAPNEVSDEKVRLAISGLKPLEVAFVSVRTGEGDASGADLVDDLGDLLEGLTKDMSKIVGHEFVPKVAQRPGSDGAFDYWSESIGSWGCLDDATAFYVSAPAGVAAIAGDWASIELSRALEVEKQREDAESGEARFHERVLAAVMREMGDVAPTVASKAYADFADALKSTINGGRTDKAEIISAGLRTFLQNAYFESENDAGAYGANWRREIVLHGKRGLAEESDAALIERIVLMVSPGYLSGNDARWCGEFEPEFLAVMAKPEVIDFVQALIQKDDDVEEFVIGLNDRYNALGILSPFTSMLQAEGEVPRG